LWVLANKFNRFAMQTQDRWQWRGEQGSLQRRHSSCCYVSATSVTTQAEATSHPAICPFEFQFLPRANLPNSMRIVYFECDTAGRAAPSFVPDCGRNLSAFFSVDRAQTSAPVRQSMPSECHSGISNGTKPIASDFASIGVQALTSCFASRNFGCRNSSESLEIELQTTPAPAQQISW
jgi:hypothetical protein